MPRQLEYSSDATTVEVTRNVICGLTHTCSFRVLELNRMKTSRTPIRCLHDFLVSNNLAERERMHVYPALPSLIPVHLPLQCRFQSQLRKPVQLRSRLAGIQLKISSFVKGLRLI